MLFVSSSSSRYHHEAHYIMATLKEVDHTAVDGSDKKLPTQEETGERTERRHVDVLLDMSEEDFMKELEPHQYHCYSGWEEAVSEYIFSYSKTVKYRLYQQGMWISVFYHSLE